MPASLTPPGFLLCHGASGSTAAPGGLIAPPWPPSPITAGGLTVAPGGLIAPPPPGSATARGSTMAPGSPIARGIEAGGQIATLGGQTARPFTVRLQHLYFSSHRQ
jgi:hypothetical protein